jgi:hypothetical protein
MKTLFLQAPSCDGFDGGAGSRYQAEHNALHPSLERFLMQWRLHERVESFRLPHASDA